MIPDPTGSGSTSLVKYKYVVQSSVIHILIQPISVKMLYLPIAIYNVQMILFWFLRCWREAGCLLLRKLRCSGELQPNLNTGRLGDILELKLQRNLNTGRSGDILELNLQPNLNTGRLAIRYLKNERSADSVNIEISSFLYIIWCKL